MQHDLKSWPRFFEPIVAGKKRHDLRRNTDREFSVGDHLRLREYLPDRGYTGRECLVEVTYITSHEYPCALSDIAISKDFSIISIVLVEDTSK